MFKILKKNNITLRISNQIGKHSTLPPGRRGTIRGHSLQAVCGGKAHARVWKLWTSSVPCQFYKQGFFGGGVNILFEDEDY